VLPLEAIPLRTAIIAEDKDAAKRTAGEPQPADLSICTDGFRAVRRVIDCTATGSEDCSGRVTRDT